MRSPQSESECSYERDPLAQIPISSSASRVTQSTDLLPEGCDCQCAILPENRTFMPSAGQPDAWEEFDGITSPVL